MPVTDFEETLSDLRVIGRTLKFILLAVVPVALFSLVVSYSYVAFFTTSFLATALTVAARLLRYDSVANLFMTFAKQSVAVFSTAEPDYEPDLTTTKGRVQDIKVTMQYGIVAPFIGTATLAFVAAGFLYNALDKALDFAVDKTSLLLGIDWSTVPEVPVSDDPNADRRTVLSRRTMRTQETARTEQTTDSNSTFLGDPRIRLIRGAQRPSELTASGAFKRTDSTLSAVSEDADLNLGQEGRKLAAAGNRP